MTNFTLSLLFCIVLLYPMADGKLVVSPFLQDRNKCDDICKSVMSYIPLLNEKTAICERGCRFFNIIYLIDGHTINSTKRECQTACKEAYDSEDFKHCIIGCEATLWKQKESTIDLITVEGKHTDSVHKLVMTDVGLREKNLYLDRYLFKPEHFNFYNFKYNIPESKIRTMPIDGAVFPDLYDNNSTDWYECIRWRGNLTKLFLFGSCLLALISFLLFSLLTTYIKGLMLEKQGRISDYDLDYVDSDTDNEVDNPVNPKELVKLVAVCQHNDKHLMV